MTKKISYKQYDPDNEELMMMPTHEELVSWLKSKHISFWGEGFQMEKEGASRGADWMLDQLKSLREYLLEEEDG